VEAKEPTEKGGDVRSKSQSESQVDRSAANLLLRRTRRKKFIVRFLVASLGAVVVLGGGYILLCVQLMQGLRMDNEVSAEQRSPDGQYVATLAYRNGPTFGFYFVSLQPAEGWHSLDTYDPIPETEVAEVAAEGLGPVEWKGPHKLVIWYNSSGMEKAMFVKQQKHWRDVQIVYSGSSDK
jgi:hypothetical protein